MTINSYKAAGVNIEAGNEAVRRIKKAAESTFSKDVLTSIGSFGAMYDLSAMTKQYRHPVLVQSIDGVGTKMIVARMMQKFDTIGIDLVSATTNDIVVLGAQPLTLLDYIANDQLQPEVIEQIIKGMAQACLENNISLIGGETAEMPDTYRQGEYDLVGVVTGVVEKEAAILGKDIIPGDVVLAFPSSGLHTNGYSLARKLFFTVGGFNVDSLLPELNASVGETLLVPHLNYTQPILHLLKKKIAIKGMAHITGGGMLENIPRILPLSCAIVPIFKVLQDLGKLSEKEMYRTFNMGVGLVMMVAPDVVAPLQQALANFKDFPCYEIGRVVMGERTVRLI
jgi:phosphoribosylformylglycinamidine cyclo-ligase